MVFELLEQRVAHRSHELVVQVRLQCVQDDIRKAIVFDDEALVLEAAVGEIEDARDRYPVGLLDATGLRAAVSTHREKIRVGAPVRTEGLAQGRERTELVAAAQ